MKRVVLLLVVVLFSLTAIPASAQTDTPMAFVRVQLWPEYDRPAMLVIYSLQLAADVDLPTQVSIRIPASVGEPTAVAVAEDNTLMTRAYERTVDGDWATITLEADSPVIQLEYYDFGFKQNGDQRSFDYLWPGDFSVEEFAVNVQQPASVSQLTVEPALGAPAQAGDGLFYHSASLGSLSAGEEFALSVSYNKTDASLSVDSLSSAPVSQESASQPTVSISGDLPLWVWVLVGVGAGFVVIGAIYFVRTNQANKPNSSYRSKKQRTAGSRTGGKKVFCHKCGHAAGPADKFCRECGTKLRV